MKIHLHNNGFTLVETLVAISVLLLVIVGPMTIAQRGIQNARFASEQVTATFLAQEAIESVRELRDNDALDAFDRLVNSLPSGNTWAWHNIILPTPCTNGSGNCRFETGNGFSFCSGSTCTLNIDSNGKYTHGVGVTSPFTRRVYVDEYTIGPDRAASVTVDVSWDTRIFGGPTTRHVTLQTWIYDQYKRYE